MTSGEAKERLEQFFESFVLMLRYLSSTSSGRLWRGREEAWWRRFEMERAVQYAKQAQAALR